MTIETCSRVVSAETNKKKIIIIINKNITSTAVVALLTRYGRDRGISERMRSNKRNKTK